MYKIYIIVLGYSIKIIYVFFSIVISRKLGKILFIEKLDVINKILWGGYLLFSLFHLSLIR
jgi:hypothetical protein